MHSRTSSTSYVKDFQELVKAYSSKRTTKERSDYTRAVTEDLEDALEHSGSATSDSSDGDEMDEQDDELSSRKNIAFSASKGRQLSVEFLEDDFDDIQTADDFDGMSVRLTT